MTKRIFAVILLLFSIAGHLSYAQSAVGSTKIYSGYLHKSNSKKHSSFLKAIFSGKSSKVEDVDQSNVCGLEFKCPPSLSHQSPMVVPEKLAYFIKFNKDVLGKFMIKFYTNDGEEYSIDPNGEGRQIGPNGPHYLYDTYQIYLILGQDIDHFEVVSASGDTQQKYVLDKLIINDDQ